MEEAFEEVLKGFPIIFIKEMNDTLTKEITQHDLYGLVDSMDSGKFPRHDGIPIEFLKCLWLALGCDFYQMIWKNITRGIP